MENRTRKNQKCKQNYSLSKDILIKSLCVYSKDTGATKILIEKPKKKLKHKMKEKKQ